MHTRTMYFTKHLVSIAKPDVTLMRTSPAFGGATSIVSILNGFFASQATAALHCIGCEHTNIPKADKKHIYIYI